MDTNQDTAKLHPLICTTFFFAYIWAIGGNLITKSIESFDSFARELFSDTNDVKVSTFFIIYTIYSYVLYVSTTKDSWEWRSL